MTVPLRTFTLFGLVFGMLATGYFLAPAPRASTPLPAHFQARAVPPEPPRPESTLVANRPPVPLMTQPRHSYRTPGDTSPPESGDTPQAPGLPTAGNDSEARRAIEFDGYKNVRDLVKGPDGSWRGRAMRGRTEIAVRVDASGNVSAE